MVVTRKLKYYVCSIDCCVIKVLDHKNSVHSIRVLCVIHIYIYICYSHYPLVRGL